MEFDLKDEHPGYYPEPQDRWRYFAAPYALNAFKNGEATLCGRCTDLRLTDRLKRRECYSDDPFIAVREQWEDNIFEITIDKTIMDSSCSLCNIFASLTTHKPKQQFLNVFVPTGSNGYFNMHLEETVSNQMRIQCHQQGDTAQNLLDFVGWPKDPKVIDWARVKEYISFCDKHHGDKCFLPRRLPVKGLQLYNCATGKLEDAPRTQTKAAKALGYTYIWVDQVCIDQDNSAQKMEQILQMDLIYQNADLTIIAASSDSAAHGIHGVSSLSRPRQKFAKFGDHVILQLAFALGSIPAIRRRRFKWNTRAWTFQEEILSRRLLYLADDMAYFVCCVIDSPFIALEGLPRPEVEKNAREAWLKQRPKIWKSIHSPMSLQVRIEHFSDLIGEYTGRQISYTDDILNGFTGILQAFHRMQPELSHLWGAPIIEFPGVTGDANQQNSLSTQAAAVVPCGLLPGLKWVAPNPGGKRRDNFPSWSWTGWEMKAVYDWQGGERDVIDDGISVGVELINGDVLPWSKFHQMSYLRDDTKNKSRFIHLNIWTTKVKVSSDTPFSQASQNNTFKAVLETTGERNTYHPGLQP
ncbi:hypothetical protein PT974_07416 [Cladobotryum mycophilum]|uniref:Heterokaryon incompatibility domain-containing protein n=1 Tax=Cladobotryum mycophilum TaxID=491253 RepID=A0ABR0SPG0_9HYPO